MATILENFNIDALGGNDGITATTDTYVVEQNIHVSAHSAGFSTVVDGTGLINYGGIYSANSDAVLFAGANDTLINGLGGTISGSTGVGLAGTDGSVVNLGAIFGVTDDGVRVSGAGNVVYNHGYIYGHDHGINEDSVDGGWIRNSGVIDGDHEAIYAGGAVGAHTSVINTGTIGGQSADAIRVDVGNLFLNNSGKIVFDIHLYAGESDTIINSGSISGMVMLGGGNDQFDGTGGTVGSVSGGTGNDLIIGGRSGDFLSGDDGNDTLTGGPGADQFIFTGALNASTNLDRITDFSPVADRIDLDHDFFVGTGAAGGVLSAAAFYRGHHAHDASDRIIYDKTTGALFYDSNGNAAGGEVKFAVVAHNLAITHADFLIV
jgi:Ca2+-binding RTX toxin-like protein